MGNHRKARNFTFYKKLNSASVESVLLFFPHNFRHCNQTKTVCSVRDDSWVKSLRVVHPKDATKFSSAAETGKLKSLCDPIRP